MVVEKTKNHGIFTLAMSAVEIPWFLFCFFFLERRHSVP